MHEGGRVIRHSFRQATLCEAEDLLAFFAYLPEESSVTAEPPSLGKSSQHPLPCRLSSVSFELSPEADWDP